MSITARRLNRATLGRQLLPRREPLDVAEAVRRVVALQAQSAASPYLALWNRLAGFDPAGSTPPSPTGRWSRSRTCSWERLGDRQPRMWCALAGPAPPGGFTLLAYADRSRVIPPAYRRLITRQNGDVLPTLLVDGYMAGV